MDLLRFPNPELTKLARRVEKIHLELLGIQNEFDQLILDDEEIKAFELLLAESLTEFLPAEIFEDL